MCVTFRWMRLLTVPHRPWQVGQTTRMHTVILEDTETTLTAAKWLISVLNPSETRTTAMTTRHTSVSTWRAILRTCFAENPRQLLPPANQDPSLMITTEKGVKGNEQPSKNRDRKLLVSSLARQMALRSSPFPSDQEVADRGKREDRGHLYETLLEHS